MRRSRFGRRLSVHIDKPRSLKTCERTNNVLEDTTGAKKPAESALSVNCTMAKEESSYRRCMVDELRLTMETIGYRHDGCAAHCICRHILGSKLPVPIGFDSNVLLSAPMCAWPKKPSLKLRLVDLRSAVTLPYVTMFDAIFHHTKPLAGVRSSSARHVLPGKEYGPLGKVSRKWMHRETGLSV